MSDNTQQGLQNQAFGVLVFLFTVISLILQVIPMFVIQRTLYEARERKCRTYHWAAFVLSNILTELVWNTGVAIICFLAWYYPTGLLRNAEYTGTVHARSTLVFLTIWVAFLFGSTLAHALIAGSPDSESASALANVLGILMYAFCGILVQKENLPGFWIFMYRCNPFTYLASSFLSAAIGEAPVHCATDEFLTMSAPGQQTCGEYLAAYVETAGGYVSNPSESDMCQYCPISSTTEYLTAASINFGDRWRDFGLMWVYICVNIAAAVALYWLCRVPKGKRK